MKKNKGLEETKKANIKPKDTEFKDIKFEEETNNQRVIKKDRQTEIQGDR